MDETLKMQRICDYRWLALSMDRIALGILEYLGGNTQAPCLSKQR